MRNLIRIYLERIPFKTWIDGTGQSFRYMRGYFVLLIQFRSDISKIKKRKETRKIYRDVAIFLRFNRDTLIYTKIIFNILFNIFIIFSNIYFIFYFYSIFKIQKFKNYYYSKIRKKQICLLTRNRSYYTATFPRSSYQGNHTWGFDNIIDIIV